jgi:hypothetical protein
MIQDRDVVVFNLLILLLLALMFIGTVISPAGGLGLMIGATIVTLWNIARL